MRKKLLRNMELLQWTRSGVDTDIAFEGEPVQFRSRMCAREFKSDDRPDLYAGTPPLEGPESNNIDSEPHGNVFNHAHIDVSRAYFHAKAPETRADTSSSERQNGHRYWESRTDVRNEGRGQQLGT